MAGKSRRVASRQSQLNRKRKKGPGSVLPSAPAPVEADGQNSEVAPGVLPEAPRPTPQQAPARPSPVAARRTSVPTATASAGPARTPSRVRGERPPTYNYIRAEVRRILLMASGVLAVIIALGVVL